MKILTSLLFLLILGSIELSAQCGKGMYLNGAICDSCEAGYYCPGDSIRYQCALGNGCLKCDSITGNCISCPAGYQKDSTGCLACAPGYYKGISGPEECSPCAMGYFQPMPGGTECFACMAGTFSSNIGSINCLKCSEGTYQPEVGSTGCLNCPSGYTSPLGSDSLSDCYIITRETNIYTGETIEFLYNRCSKIIILKNRTTCHSFRLNIYSLSGKLVSQNQWMAEKLILNLSDLQSGVYLFEIVHHNVRFVKKIPIY
jgi:hypothetical protein